MRRVAEENSFEDSRIILGLLDAVEQDRALSQRDLAAELGIALGLVNAYLKRCIKKGLLKVRQAPARRYAYYITPQGFTEKSRLTVEYLSHSFGFFRKAKNDCSELLLDAKKRGVGKIVLFGQSDLAEVAALCALEQSIEIVGLVQSNFTQAQFIGIPVFQDFDAITNAFDAVLITDLTDAYRACEQAVARFDLDRVLIPRMLRVRFPHEVKAAE
ncbi:MAG: winged helix-turn-helix domain-containing protein [Pseudolabrys sp.]|nr:winged helix-turn-helix domain-containing protein [Pseudolabrys sp.]